MRKFKVTCTEDNEVFVVTSAFKKLCTKFRSLKTSKGRIIGIVGSPGTGKSANIYHAQSFLDLKLYDVELKLETVKLGPKEVYDKFVDKMKEDLGVKTRHEIYCELSKFDALLFADKMLDSGDVEENKIGLSEWLQYNRLKSIIFYFIVIYELIKHRKGISKINMVFHLTWSFIFNEKKYDLLSDFSVLSIFLRGILKLFFEVIEIEYSESETIQIVKTHFEGINESQIKSYIQKYGYIPRYILQAIENQLITLKKVEPDIKMVEPVCKPR